MEKELDLIKQDISKMLKINSIRSESKENMPFGEGVAHALNEFLKTAQEMGFETYNYDNYVGEIIYGEGKEFAILAHLDTVPEGTNWSKNPFSGEIDDKNKKIWGRGAMDNKGPAVIILHTLKKLKDLGLKPKRKIKFILGCNEESGWKCIEHYKKVNTLPDEGFSPDADFPAIYAEKGILHIKFKFELEKCNFHNLSGGNTMNMVCDYCEVETLSNSNAFTDFKLELSENKLISRGKSAHASTPYLGKNAIANMLQYLNLNHIYNLLFVEKFGLSELKDQTGNLTFSPNIISQNLNELYVTCDIRYPATMKLSDIMSIIGAYGIKYEILNHQEPLFNDENSELIQTLNNAYCEVTGKNVKPIAIGGGTYARALKHGVAFGPQELDEESTIHQADEYITFKTIENCYKIYFLAIKNLCFEES